MYGPPRVCKVIRIAQLPGLRQQLQDAVHAYARGITIDREAIVTKVTRGGQQPAYRFTPAGLTQN